MSGNRGNGRRAPPAYQEYAADLLADRAFKSMSAAERGVLFSMRLECWVNRCVPSDSLELARVLGLQESEVKQGLTERVRRYFAAQEGTGGILVCPELDAYRDRLDERHAKMSEGGRKGADHTNQSRRDRATNRESSLPDAHPDAHPASIKGGHPDAPLSTTEQNTAESNPVYRESNEHDEFIKELDGPSSFEEAALGQARKC